ncbi:TraB/GumN family protein [Saccharopolyspora pogona]|uniref:hypothetical protein n=1 Tax=Saccharopolyspora pogona TaxID=333966 RepID=UPI001685E342|nr:hypothetical protein [Saccharopolyspora pogona]
MVRQHAEPIDYGKLFGDARVLMLGEDHRDRAIRRHLVGYVQRLKDIGVTHYAVEAPANPAFQELNAGRDVSLSGVDVGPAVSGGGYEEVVRAVSRAGIEVVPVDVDQSEEVPLVARGIRSWLIGSKKFLPVLLVRRLLC